MMNNFGRDIFCIISLFVSSVATEAAEPGIDRNHAFGERTLAIETAPEYNYNTISGIRFSMRPDAILSFDGEDFISYKCPEISEYYWITRKWDESGKGHVFIPSETDSEHMFSFFPFEESTESPENGSFNKCLLFDFSLQPGNTFSSVYAVCTVPDGWYLEFYHIDGVTVEASRTVNICGEPKRVQKLVYPDDPNLTNPSDYKKPYTAIAVEGIGCMEASSFTGLPMMKIYPAGFYDPYSDSTPNFECCSFKINGENEELSVYQLGLSLSDQLLREGSIWEYYSEDEHYCAVHKIAQIATEKVCGKEYRVLGTISCDLISKETGEKLHFDKSQLNPNVKWLMREDFGRVYTLLPDGTEIQTYDFAFQPGDTYKYGENEYSVTGTNTKYKFQHTITSTQPVKSYIISNEDGEESEFSEFWGCWGRNAGFIPFPAVFSTSGTPDYAITPDTPSSDCTLSRLIGKGDAVKFATPEYGMNVIPFYLEFAGFDDLPCEDAANHKESCFDILGRSINPSSAKGINIIRNNGKVRKVMK